MPFTQELPVWHATGTAVPTNLKNNGWAALMKPPAAYFNYLHNRTYLALKELQEKAALSADVTALQSSLDAKTTSAQVKTIVRENLKSGAVAISSPGANTTVNVPVTFAIPFENAPAVTLGVNIANPSVISVSISSISRNGFTINYVRTNSTTTETFVYWIAAERG